MKHNVTGRDLVPLLAGIYAFLSPLWSSATHRSGWTVVVLGVITAVAALAVLLRPHTIPFEGFMSAIGAVFFVSPWVMGFAGMHHPMAWTAWIVGALTFFVGLGDFVWDRENHTFLTPHTH